MLSDWWAGYGAGRKCERRRHESFSRVLCTSFVWLSSPRLGNNLNKPINVNTCFLEFCESLWLIIKHQEGLWWSFICNWLVRSLGDNLGCGIGVWSRGQSVGLRVSPVLYALIPGNWSQGWVKLPGTLWSSENWRRNAWWEKVTHLRSSGSGE